LGAGQPDSAAVEIEALLTALRGQEAREVGEGYESKALWEQALGRIYEIRGDTARSRRAYERSLEEALSWYPSRMGLARLEQNAGNAPAAAEQLARAVEAEPDDGVVRLEYCSALLAVQRPADALEHCEAALRQYPYWAEAYLRTGGAYDQLGRTADAAKMYRQYLERAPRRNTRMIEIVTRRLARIAPEG
jgi:tetratricopeptide (TPR) repeat protein